MYKTTTATEKIFSLKKRIRAVAGGTAASKTISILIWCIDYAQMHRGKLITVVSESFPHLLGGAMLDFQNIMKAQGYWDDKSWVQNPRATYTFQHNGSKIEFISVDTFGKAHGPRRDVLFINEANNLPYNIADQLITRTREIVWLDWNPSAEFWFYTEMQPFRQDLDFITLTYKDNEALDKVTVDEIESHKHNLRWWRVYGEGQLGDSDDRVYTGWAVVDAVPHEARLIRYGLDFGYSNDPTAIVGLYKHDGAYVLDEVVYQKGMSNKAITDTLNNLDKALVKADSAEPKSIDEIKLYGINILPVAKGKDSVNSGIQLVQSERISITKRSVNTIKEYRNYLWEFDKDGHKTNNPSEVNNHSMDAIRYAFEGLVLPIEIPLVQVGYELGLGGVMIPTYDYE